MMQLDALARYHQAFAEQMASFADADLRIVQQVAEGDRVVTQLTTTAQHVATGRTVHLDTIRLDRIDGDRIAEHWSVSDLAGLGNQSADAVSSRDRPLQRREERNGEWDRGR